MKKKILSGILAIAMCFSMTPSMVWGDETMEFSSGEELVEGVDYGEVFTDEPESEDENSVAAAESTENVSAFSDRTLEVETESSDDVGVHTVTIDTKDYIVKEQQIFDVKNNHNGTLTIGEMPKIVGDPNRLTKEYQIAYAETTHTKSGVPTVVPEGAKYYGRRFNSEYSNKSGWAWTNVTGEISKNAQTINSSTKINTEFFVGIWRSQTNNPKTFYYANYQIIVNPVEVTYDAKGGTGGPRTDWVWTRDNEWNSDHNNIPEKLGYIFDGWYAKDKDGNEIKINNVGDAVKNAQIKGPNLQKHQKIELYAKWSHKHEWNYSLDESGSTIRAFCSGADTGCEYYGKNITTANNYAVLSLGLKESNSNSIIYSGEAIEAAIKENTIAGAKVSEITYQKYNETSGNYEEITRPPVDVGIYRAKVTVGDDNNKETAILRYTIERATPSITLPDEILTYTGKTAEYGISEVKLSGNESYNKETDGEIKYSYREDGSEKEFTDGLPVNAGTYEVKAAIAAFSNYNEASVTAKLVIKPKDVTVTPDNVSKHIKTDDPEITYQTKGLIEGDSLYGITLKRTPGEDARDYDIIPEYTGTDPNYKVTLEKGIFTINDHDWSGEANVLVYPTRWSEGSQEKICAFKGCNEKRYDTIPRTSETTKDSYAGRIDKYAMVFPGANVKSATLNNKETEFLNASGIFGAEEKEKIEKQNKNAKVWIEIAAVALDSNQYDLIKKEAEKISGSNIVSPTCINIKLLSQLVGEDVKPITAPGINMNIRLGIPDEMVNKQPYTIRNYKVIRLHTDPTTKFDTVDVLDTSFNASSNEITFETDRFSVYALTYKDTYYSPSYPVTGIKVFPDTLTLTKKDETAQLTAEVTPSYADNKRVTWKSSDEKVATVDESGKVTAVANGTATITATSVSGGYTANVTITVKIPVEIEKITVAAEKETLTQIGETTELKVKIEPGNADPQKLIWKSSDEKVAVVDENGKVTAVGNGTVTITVTTEDGKQEASIEITVKIPEEPVINNITGFGRLRARSVKQTKTSVTLQWNRIKGADGYLIYGNRCNVNGKVYKYKKLVTITDGKTQSWTQEELKKGTFYKYIVKAYKLVNGKKVITDTSVSVHAVTQGGKYGIAKSVSVIKLGSKKNTLEITLKKGETDQITAKEIKKDNKIKLHRNLCYESSNTKVATVTSKGLIRAVGKGTCTIWVYAQNGVYKALTITVK